MRSEFSLLFLGTGTSVGVPQIACSCDVCQSENPRNKRLRSSVLVTYGDAQVLIDSGPDLRQQALREQITHIEAVAYTHEHLDHLAGFDDLRAFCWHREERLPMYGTPETLACLQRMYPWAFGNEYRGYVRPDPRNIQGGFSIGEMQWKSFDVAHAKVRTVGYLVEAEEKRLAYACDVKSIPEESLRMLKNVDVLVIDCLRGKHHETHMNLEETLEVIKHISPQQSYLTHMSHEVNYDTFASKLPENVFLAYDGLRIKL